MAGDEAINHDGASTVATVGAKAAQWGALGAVAAFLLPPVILIAGGYAAIALGSAGTVAAVVGAVVIAAASIAGALATWGLGAAGAAGGAALGLLKGADQVSRETSAFRARVTERMNNRENKDAKNFSDGEVKGLDEGYALAVADLKPQLEAAREQGRQEGAQMVVEQIQQHMQAEMAAQQAAEQGHGKHNRVDAAHDLAGAHKPPVKIGQKVIASCECSPDGTAMSKAEAITAQQHAGVETPHIG